VTDTTTRDERSSAPERDAAYDAAALQEKWLSEQAAVENAADETEGLAERRSRAKKTPKGDRTGGSPVAPTGVPKSDHVAAPTEAPQSNGISEPGSANPFRAD